LFGLGVVNAPEITANEPGEQLLNSLVVVSALMLAKLSWLGLQLMPLASYVTRTKPFQPFPQSKTSHA
jgi:hypothetical protein